MEITAYDIAQRFVGIKEVPGKGDNPLILAMLKLDDPWPGADEVPWCSAFMNFVAFVLRLPRSKSLLARSWLQVGTPVLLYEARVGFDVVVLKRGEGDQPGPENVKAPGHVGLYAGWEDAGIYILGGNQSDTVSVNHYPVDRLLGIRRLYGPRPIIAIENQS